MQTRQEGGQFQVSEQLLTTLSYVTPSSTVVSAQRSQDASGVYNSQAVVTHLEAKIQNLILDNQRLLAFSGEIVAANQSLLDQNRSLQFNLQASHQTISIIQTAASRSFLEKDLLIRNLQAKLLLFKQAPISATVIRSDDSVSNITSSNSTDSSDPRPPSPFKL